ncbi:hypothetical protein PGB90_008015 [Kerria lacca]
MQIYVLMTTTLMVTAQLHNSVLVSRKFVNGDMAFQHRVKTHFHKRRGKITPVQISEYNTGTALNPIVFNPLFTRFFAAGETTTVKTLKTPFYEIGNHQPHNQNDDDDDDDGGGAETERVHVPSYFKESTIYSTNNVNQPTDETHDKQIIGNNSHYEHINNSTIVEYLPIITAPFFDTLTHGIIGEIQQHVQLIKPGTKWCGDGNKARSYEDVGVLYKTDKCCRNHDRCPYYILAHETKYGLHNDAHFTRSHCDCDASFFDCLKKANSPFSTGVGITYFNILKMKCFRLEYPVVMCSQSAGWFSKHCVEYIVDMSKHKQWQWFDNHEF